MTVLGGVVAPVSELPPPFEALARLLPLGYASDALREVFGGGPAEELVPHFAAVLVVGAAWFALGHLAWTLARRSARRSGTADLI
jgi:ABC-type multidrug transport system permease subunit